MNQLYKSHKTSQLYITHVKNKCQVFLYKGLKIDKLNYNIYHSAGKSCQCEYILQSYRTAACCTVHITLPHACIHMLFLLSSSKLRMNDHHLSQPNQFPGCNLQVDQHEGFGRHQHNQFPCRMPRSLSQLSTVKPL